MEKANQLHNRSIAILKFSWSFPVLSADIPGLWIVYTIVSISFSLVVSCFLDKVEVKIFSKTR